MTPLSVGGIFYGFYDESGKYFTRKFYFSIHLFFGGITIKVSNSPTNLSIPTTL